MKVVSITADGNSAVYRTAGLKSRGLSIIADGTWGSGTLKVQILAEGVWIDVAAATLTDDGTIFVEWAEAATFRVNMAGSTTPAVTVLFGG